MIDNTHSRTNQEAIVRENLLRLAELIESDPRRAAAELRRQASALIDLAERLEQTPIRSPAGTADRLQMQVFGPDGSCKQHVDTGDPLP